MGYGAGYGGGPYHGGGGGGGPGTCNAHPYIIPPPKKKQQVTMAGFGHCSYGGFLKWWVSPTTMGVSYLKMIMTWGVEIGGTTNFRKHPYGVTAMFHGVFLAGVCEGFRETA